MTLSTRKPLSSRAICLLIMSSGFATLSWEVIWQIKSTLALGVSAWGTAITLAATMGGMSIGGFLMGHALRHGSPLPAVRMYGALEGLIGLAGLGLNAAFRAVEHLDTFAYSQMPGSASLVHILGIVAVLGVPTICMGATFPVFGLIAGQFRLSIAELYGLNTIGAAVGVLFAALVLIPWVGVTHTMWAIAAINITVGIIAWRWAPLESVAAPQAEEKKSEPVSWKDIFIVSVTGFATFTLEIAWFRSLAVTFPNTTDVFAIMLACMLIALGMASRKVPQLKQKQKPLGRQLCLAGILILIATPIIEQFNFVLLFSQSNLATALHLNHIVSPDSFAIGWMAVGLYALQILVVFFATFCAIVPPVKYLGVAFPWILDGPPSSRRMGNLYAVNTLSAIVGAIGTAWLLLPTIGFAPAAWLAGILVVIAGIIIMPGRKSLIWIPPAMAALLFAVYFEAGVVRTHLKGHLPAAMLEFFNGPEATVSVVQYDDGTRRLFIDSSSASGESGTVLNLGEHYMTWMGHLPMLLQPDPKNALVICFGTGQTANAVRRENPESLDIVDINPRIFRLSHHFKSNEGVLSDPKVKAIVMDGRAYMRRATKTYDVITLEPMPPTNAGVNALYSREFYQLARQRLSAKGVIAQWLPLHEVSPHSAASIARTFMDVFPNAVLWLDPDSKSDGILLGSKDDSVPLATVWPGFARSHARRNLSEKEVLQSVALDAKELEQYAKYGDIITDDNQMLAYGKALYSNMGMDKENFQLLHRVNSKIVVP